MDKNQISWNERAAQQIILNLEKRRMEGSYAATAAQAVDEVLAMIPHGATVLSLRFDYHHFDGAVEKNSRSAGSEYNRSLQARAYASGKRGREAQGGSTPT